MCASNVCYPVIVAQRTSRDGIGEGLYDGTQLGFQRNGTGPLDGQRCTAERGRSSTAFDTEDYFTLDIVFCGCLFVAWVSTEGVACVERLDSFV